MGLACLACYGALAADQPSSRPDEPALIALIIDDLGNGGSLGRRAADLPGPVACAVLPHTPFGAAIAERAHAAGKEVMLHLPLQPMEEIHGINTGVIMLENNQSQLNRIFQADLDSVPHVVGINGHMGSLLTRHPGHMKWLMEAIIERGDLFFVDSVTTPDSVALQVAREHRVPSVRRDVFLDNEVTAQAIDAAFERLKIRARANGAAVGIGHPYPETLAFLERALPALSDEGFKLVPVARLLEKPESDKP